MFGTFGAPQSIHRIPALEDPSECVLGQQIHTSPPDAERILNRGCRERESALQQLSVQRSFEASMGGIVQGLSVQGGSWYLNGGPFVQASHFHPARRTATNPVCASGVVTAVPLGCVEEVCVCVCHEVCPCL